MVVADFGTGQVFLSMLSFCFFVIWVWLVVVILADILTSADLPGWGKAVWSFLVIVLPFFGAFTYVMARAPSDIQP
jgi:predicted membrane channel-forming protein YqfA (hemolysin III family)